MISRSALIQALFDSVRLYMYTERGTNRKIFLQEVALLHDSARFQYVVVYPTKWRGEGVEPIHVPISTNNPRGGSSSCRYVMRRINQPDMYIDDIVHITEKKLSWRQVRRICRDLMSNEQISA